MIELANESAAMTAFMNGITSFVGYFALSLAFLVAFKFIYMGMTPYNEWKLIKEDKNLSAAIALGGAVIGYAIAISSAAEHSVGIIDYALWGAVALVAQALGYVGVRSLMMPKLVQRIEADEKPAAVLLASVSIAVGLLNAACLTY
ncbi:DUF350 domain-containing protein [Vibrio parahaemolyticus]|uniref:DUF350 domain-containing protein n=1 Tax=Vibrio TaxID=662 RepID=UPI001A8C4689|nr:MULTISPECIES: DUF350 domain-containing protein [Vibrio]EGQ7973440.1 DUF350 domain-containing protein [Vibrio parahaemolyticus]MBO0208658.1 DUF350 domain-containing protein [Vibrio sp. Vb0877]MCR9808267.1 DUF350 domain-containing protein [Vibrio parahaemolyticus]MDW2322688.1 DUF350 domain-containing protein [Vibrio sp. 1159]